jgi:hypothetical protein
VPITNFSKNKKVFTPILWIDAGLTSSYSIGDNTIYDISNHNNNLIFNGNVIYSNDFVGSLLFNGQIVFCLETTFSNLPQDKLTELYGLNLMM